MMFRFLMALCLMASLLPARAQDSVLVERVVIPNGKIVLDGVLVRHHSTDKKAAMIFLGGSGEWEIAEAYLKNPTESYGNLLRFYGEEKLLSENFAFLYLNKRGIGKATGNWRKSDFDDRASDAYAAFLFLKNHPAIDAKRVGLIGHSQGGWIAQLAASKYPEIAFSISLAGPSMGVYAQTLLNDRQSYACEGLSLREQKRKTRMRKIELGLGGAIGKLIGGEAGQWARIRKYNHDAAIKNLKSPALFVFAGHDTFVPPQENVDYLKQLFPSGMPANIHIHVQPGIDHSFHEVPGPCIPWQEASKNNFSEPLRHFLTGWIRQYSACE